MQTDPRELLRSLLRSLPTCCRCDALATVGTTFGQRCESHSREPNVFTFELIYGRELADVLAFTKAEDEAMATREGRSVRKVLAELTPDVVARETRAFVEKAERFDWGGGEGARSTLEHISLSLSGQAASFDLASQRDSIVRSAAALVGFAALLDLGAAPAAPAMASTMPPPPPKGGES